MKKITLLLLLVLLIPFSTGLGVTGRRMLISIDFEPGFTTTDCFTVRNAEGFTSTYDIVPIHIKGADLSQYFSMSPKRIENVPDGGSAHFCVELTLPDKIDIAGETEMWAKVQIDFQSTGVIRAIPAVAVRYLVYVLHPYKYIEWDLHASNINIDEAADITISLINYGEPTIGSAHGDIVIRSTESGEIVRTLKTQTERNIESWENRNLISSFDSRGLAPGNYMAEAILYWDTNVSTKEKEFRIGTKNVKILNYTKLFEINQINKFDIQIESAWNTKLSNIYADITVNNPDTGSRVASFRSVNTELNPWQTKSLEAYFDTKGLEKREYNVIINLLYEGTVTREDGVIRVDENIGAEVVDEIPGKFKLSSLFTLMNLLVLLLVVFLVLNIYLLSGYLRKKPEEIDPAVIEKVRELKKKYNDDYIKDLMSKKGWSKEKIEQILKKVK
jgi:hypothetical protein